MWRRHAELTAPTDRPCSRCRFDLLPSIRSPCPIWPDTSGLWHAAPGNAGPTAIGSPHPQRVDRRGHVRGEPALLPGGSILMAVSGPVSDERVAGHATGVQAQLIRGCRPYAGATADRGRRIDHPVVSHLAWRSNALSHRRTIASSRTKLQLSGLQLHGRLTRVEG